MYMSTIKLVTAVLATIQCVTSFTSFTSINHSLVKPTKLYLASSTPPPPPPTQQMIVNTPSVSTFSLIPEYTSNLQQKMMTNDISTSNANQLPSMSVSLVERKAPTQEEIDKKKLTFNLWFWGGGVIAPFISTVFYFGFKFWEK